MRTEIWYGHEIRFIEINGEWYAILKDICDALKLRTNDVAQRIDPNMLEKVLVETTNLMPTVSVSNSHKPVKTITKAKCPECGSELQFEGGCVICKGDETHPGCGWSKCD